MSWYCHLLWQEFQVSTRNSKPSKGARNLGGCTVVPTSPVIKRRLVAFAALTWMLPALVVVLTSSMALIRPGLAPHLSMFLPATQCIVALGATWSCLMPSTAMSATCCYSRAPSNDTRVDRAPCGTYVYCSLLLLWHRHYLSVAHGTPHNYSMLLVLLVNSILPKLVLTCVSASFAGPSRCNKAV